MVVINACETNCESSTACDKCGKSVHVRPGLARYIEVVRKVNEKWGAGWVRFGGVPVLGGLTNTLHTQRLREMLSRSSIAPWAREERCPDDSCLCTNEKRSLI